MAKEASSKSGKTPSGSRELSGGSAPAALPAVRVASSLFRPQAAKAPMAPKAPTPPKAPATASNAPPPIAPRVSMPSIPPPLPASANQSGPVSTRPRPPSPSIAPSAPLAPMAPIASEPLESIPPPPPSAPRSSRDPQNPLAVMSLASIRVQAAPPSAPRTAPPIASAMMGPPTPAPMAPPPMPMYQAPLSTTSRMPMPSTPAAFTTTPSDSPVVIPSAAPPPPPSAPPSSPASVRYERAFRSWSYSSPPPSEIDGSDPEASQGPLTYQVYTAQDMPPVSRQSRAFISQPPPPPTMKQRFGMIAVGATITLCTAAAIILGVVDDGPKAPRSATSAMQAPPAVVDPMPAPIVDPASVTTTTSFIPPVVTIVDDPNAQPTPAPRPKKKKITTGDAPIINASTTINTNAANAPAPPPNPYAVVSKK